MRKQSARFKILLYHSVGEVDPEDELGIRIERDAFYSQMEFLKEDGYDLVTLKNAVDRIENRRDMPHKAVAVTFDDGYRDNIVNAAPVLEEFGFRATFFMAVDYIGGVKTSPKRDWQRWECMDGDDLVRLQDKGHIIGSHGLRHVDLTELDKKEQKNELRLSRERLGSLLKSPVDLFSYPYGSFNEGLARGVKEEGYKAACTIVPGANDADTDLYGLKRIEIVKGDTLADFKKKINET